MPNNQTPGIGHNLDPVEALKAGLKERHVKLTNRIFALVERQGRMPAKCTSDEDVAKLTDYVAQLRDALKRLDEAHKVEKEDSLRVGQAVDKWRRDLRAEVEPIGVEANNRMQPYLDAKLAEERRIAAEKEAERVRLLNIKLAAEAAAQKQREEAEAARLAEEAEKARQDAEKAAAAAAASRATDDTPTWAEATQRAQEAAQRAEEARLDANEAAAAAAAPVEATTVVAQELDTRVRVQGQAGRALAKTVWTWEWVGAGPERFDLNLVRSWMPPEAVSAALDSAVKAGARQLGPCVRVLEKTKVVV